MTDFEAPLTFERLVVAKPWGGGERLRRLGVGVPERPPTGEVWLVSDVEGRASVIARGPHSGRSLRDLVRACPEEVLGRAARGADARFPLLVKLLEVEGTLSVQVHPNDAQARLLGAGLQGKFEAWSVLEASPEARVSLGLDRALSREDVRDLVAEERLQEHLNTFVPTVGDAYVITPGTIHAAAGGLLFLEVQETADITYRLYDWGKRGLDGQPRELHVDRALECADLVARGRGAPPRPAARSIAPGANVRPVVAEGEGPFVFEMLDLERGARVGAGGGRVPWVFVGLSGRAALRTGTAAVDLPPGASALWPASLSEGELVAETERAVVGRARPSIP
jgi:mannose-6-phosphate isomerase